ncbi:MAG: DUF805 domain-containing protein [Deltaproteobacteria bacterium]|nr:DUF805 domain-containing protein [Deltaproteobacteria bacterium]
MFIKEILSTKGRLNRAKFFWIILAILFATIIIGQVTRYFFFAIGYDEATVNSYMPIIVLIKIILDSIQVVKRFHDLDRPGSHLLLYLVPIYNIYLAFVLFLVPGTVGSNQYGEDPLEITK